MIVVEIVAVVEEGLLSVVKKITTVKQIPVTNRASQIEYAIRDVVVPASALEAKGHKVLKLNIGDPLAYPGLPTDRKSVV